MFIALQYFLYGVGVWLSVLLAVLLGGFHLAVEPEPHYWFVVVFGLLVGLLANLGLFLVPTAAKQGRWWKIAVALCMGPTASFLFTSSYDAVARWIAGIPLVPIATGSYVLGALAYMLGYLLLVRGCLWRLSPPE
jgi:hypothetical protein